MQLCMERLKNVRYANREGRPRTEHSERKETSTSVAIPTVLRDLYVEAGQDDASVPAKHQRTRLDAERGHVRDGRVEVEPSGDERAPPNEVRSGRVRWTG